MKAPLEKIPSALAPQLVSGVGNEVADEDKVMSKLKRKNGGEGGIRTHG
jgi:hypothetical protein